MGDGTNWQTGGPDRAQRLGDRALELLNRIPGYSGYRDKEGRRDADRLVRESVRAAYGRLADRTEAVGRGLADRRRITEVGPVTALTDGIRHLADRVRTAPYGYSPLFSDRVVDEPVLDQLRRFDEGLMESVAALESSIATLESASAAGTPLPNALDAAATALRAGSDRLNARSKIFESGASEPEESVVAVLQPITPAGPSDAPHAVYGLNRGDAVSVLGENAIIDARIDIEAGEQTARLFRLTLGPPARWLFVPRAAQTGYATLTEIGEETPGETISSGAPIAGSGEVSGTNQSSGRREVSVAIGRDTSGGVASVTLDWGSEQQRFTATPIHPADIELYGPSQSR